jgi:curved DNA-binding protein CbpA
MTVDPDFTLYELLGVSSDATCHQLHQLRKPLSRRYHSDNGSEPDGELMARINDAIDVLGDPLKRREYDDALWEAEHKAAKAEAERVRLARTAEVDAAHVAEFQAALAGVEARPAPSVAPPGMERPHVDAAPPGGNRGPRRWRDRARA